MSKCTAVSKFAQPTQRHKWSAVRRETFPGGFMLVRDCMNDCGDYQANFEIPASVRRQFELESSVRGPVCECGHEKSKHEYVASVAAWLCTFKSCLKAPRAKCSGYYPQVRERRIARRKVK